MADFEETRSALVAARVHFHAENKRRNGMDRLGDGRIHGFQGRDRVSDRIRRSGVQTRSRNDGSRHPVHFGGGDVRDRGADRKSGD